MYKAVKNTNYEAITTEKPKYVSLRTDHGNCYPIAYGNDKDKVEREAHFHWAVICDYTGNYMVVEASELEWTDEEK